MRVASPPGPCCVAACLVDTPVACSHSACSGHDEYCQWRDGGLPCGRPHRLPNSTWDTPRFVPGSDITVDDRLVLPRGLRHTVIGIVEEASSRFAATDARNPAPRSTSR